jgi:hypothetical protein
MKTTLKNRESRKLTLTRETLTPLQTKLYTQLTAAFMASAMAGAVVSYVACHP